MPAWVDAYILHPATLTAIDRLVSGPVHGVLVTGLKGSGKSTIVRIISSQLLGDTEISSDSYLSHPYIRIIASEQGKAISIEAIRELQHFLSLKIPGHTNNDKITRVVVIEDAHLLTTEAQNALLKTLEEPPAGTIVILTASTLDSVLPTIQSRIRQLHVQAPAKKEVESYFARRGFSQETINRSMMMSGGLPGLTHALLGQDEEHPLVVAVTHARGILQSKTYERLLLVDSLSKQKDLCLDVLYVLGRMARMSLAKATDTASGERWLRILKASNEAERQLMRSVQAKLALTNFMLAL